MQLNLSLRSISWHETEKNRAIWKTLKRLKPFHISLAELFHLSNLINKWEKNLQNILAFFLMHIFLLEPVKITHCCDIISWIAFTTYDCMSNTLISLCILCHLSPFPQIYWTYCLSSFFVNSLWWKNMHVCVHGSLSIWIYRKKIGLLLSFIFIINSIYDLIKLQIVANTCIPFYVFARRKM